MGSFDWGLELILVVLLAVTLVHAVRLERALRSLRTDRAALGNAIAGFDDSARQAEAGIGRLHSASTNTANVLTQCLNKGTSLQDDLTFLIDRGEALADRLDATWFVAAGNLRRQRLLFLVTPDPTLQPEVVVTQKGSQQG